MEAREAKRGVAKQPSFGFVPPEVSQESRYLLKKPGFNLVRPLRTAIDDAIGKTRKMSQQSTSPTKVNPENHESEHSEPRQERSPSTSSNTSAQSLPRSTATFLELDVCSLDKMFQQTRRNGRLSQIVGGYYP
uniref:Uncharacterized protein n=1 Tax=Panagrellus redivivus TaxID=6233 RepID=A0A7E4ZVL2_PANRE